MSYPGYSNPADLSYGGSYGQPAPSQPSYGAPGGYGAPQGYPPSGGMYPGYGGPPAVNPEVRQWFDAVDVDRSGRISSHELQAALVNGQGKNFTLPLCDLMIGKQSSPGNRFLNKPSYSSHAAPSTHKERLSEWHSPSSLLSIPSSFKEKDFKVQYPVPNPKKGKQKAKSKSKSFVFNPKEEDLKDPTPLLRPPYIPESSRQSRQSESVSRRPVTPKPPIISDLGKQQDTLDPKSYDALPEIQQKKLLERAKTAVGLYDDIAQQTVAVMNLPIRKETFLTIAIVPAKYPLFKISDELFISIKEALWQKIVGGQAAVNRFVPQFTGGGAQLENGAVILRCGNMSTKVWVEKTVLAMHQAIGISLKLENFLKVMGSAVYVMMVIHESLYCVSDVNVLLLKLEAQNRGLSVRDWRVRYSETYIRLQFIVLDIDFASWEFLQNSQMKLHLGLGQTDFEFLGNPDVVEVQPDTDLLIDPLSKDIQDPQDMHLDTARKHRSPRIDRPSPARNIDRERLSPRRERVTGRSHHSSPGRNLDRVSPGKDMDHGESMSRRRGRDDRSRHGSPRRDVDRRRSKSLRREGRTHRRSHSLEAGSRGRGCPKRMKRKLSDVPRRGHEPLRDIGSRSPKGNERRKHMSPKGVFARLEPRSPWRDRNRRERGSPYKEIGPRGDNIEQWSPISASEHRERRPSRERVRLSAERFSPYRKDHSRPEFGDGVMDEELHHRKELADTLRFFGSNENMQMPSFDRGSPPREERSQFSPFSEGRFRTSNSPDEFRFRDMYGNRGSLGPRHSRKRSRSPRRNRKGRSPRHEEFAKIVKESFLFDDKRRSPHGGFVKDVLTDWSPLTTADSAPPRRDKDLRRPRPRLSPRKREREFLDIRRRDKPSVRRLSPRREKKGSRPPSHGPLERRGGTKKGLHPSPERVLSKYRNKPQK